MKTSKLFFLLSLVLSMGVSAAEPKRTGSDILSQTEIKQVFYRLKTGITEAIALPMSYGENEIISEADKRKILKAKVLRVDLVYSDFPKGIDLNSLNLKRIKEIEKIRANLVSDREIEWKLIRQTGCMNEAEAKTMFHGVVIHLIDEQDEETIKKDFTFFDTYLPKEGELKKMRLPDSTIFKVLDRNKKWSDMLIVSDLTGSMSPFSTQLLLWFKLNSKNNRLKDVVFFNDGDNTPDSKKVIGETGGFYHTKATDYETILATAQKTMMAGFGGDGPENDIEALLKGMELVKDAKEVVLIADNFAPIKDYVLVEKLKKPIHVILCGTTFGINVQYLNLARKTGGSIHTMEEDLVDLIKKNEGETIKFNHRTFKIVKGEFVEIKKS